MEKLKEFLSFLICIVVILLIAYFTGFLKGFTPSDFMEAFDKTASVVTTGFDASTKYVSSESSSSKSNVVAGNYKAQPIPQNILQGSRDSKSWTNIFNSSQKVVFYIYDESNKNSKLPPDFHTRINNYLVKSKLIKYYNLKPSTLYAFEKLNWGGTGPSKMCDSIQECNEYRKKAANYSSLSDFMRKCGQTMCVINPRNNQYVILKKRDASAAIKLLNALKNW